MYPPDLGHQLRRLAAEASLTLAPFLGIGPLLVLAADTTLHSPVLLAAAAAVLRTPALLAAAPHTAHTPRTVLALAAAALPALLHTLSTAYALRVLLARTDRARARTYFRRQLAVFAAAVTAQAAMAVLQG